VPRYSLDLTDEERDQLQAMAKEEERSMMSIMRVVFKRGLHVCISASKSRQSNVISASKSRQNDACPSPTPARAGTVPEKKEEKNKKKKEEMRLAPLDVTTRILDDLNDRAGTGFRATGKKARTLIADRMRDGFTEADFYEVHRKKCAEWLDSDMCRYLTFETLYSLKFEKYLGQPDVGPQRGLAFTDGEKRADRWDKRKEPGYYDD
jgi:uncharacterized phage protein (TIGR02220 family)